MVLTQSQRAIIEKARSLGASENSGSASENSGSGLRIDFFARAIDPLNGFTQFRYDPSGSHLSVTGTLGSATTYTYDRWTDAPAVRC